MSCRTVVINCRTLLSYSSHIKTSSNQVRGLVTSQISSAIKSGTGVNMDAKEWPKITLFGDSITRYSMDPESGCWGSLVKNDVVRYFDVDVRGFDGYNTRWALEMVPNLFPKTYLDKVDLMTIFFGHNDSWQSDRMPLSVPIEEFEENLCSIITKLNQNGLSNEKLILITPTWYDSVGTEKFIAGALGEPGPHKSSDHARLYSETVLKIARERSIDVVDFFNVSVNHEPLEELFCDGIHLSKKGAKMLYDQVMPIVKKKIESRYKTPLDKLSHAIPYDERPEFVAILGKKTS